MCLHLCCPIKTENDMRKVVITRPYAKGQEFARILSKGVYDLKSGPFTIKSGRLILEPLLRIEIRDFQISNTIDYDGVIITSVNAVPAIEKNPNLLGTPFYCVGKKTAESLRSFGVVNIAQCCQTVEPLIDELKSAGRNQRFLYLRGQDVSVDIKSAMQSNDIIVDEAICYSAETVDHFSESFLDDLRNQRIGLVTLFSKRTAEVFVRLIRQQQKENSVDADQIDILCISQPVLEYVSSVFKKENIIVSDKPDMKAMAEAVHRYCS